MTGVQTCALPIFVGLQLGNSPDETAPAESQTVVQTESADTLPPEPSENTEANTDGETGIEQDETAADSFDMSPQPNTRKQSGIYELKEGQESVEKTDADGTVRIVTKKAEPSRTDSADEPVVTLNNRNKQAEAKAKRKAAEKAAAEKRLAEEQAREAAEREAEKNRTAELKKQKEAQKQAEAKKAADEKRAAEARTAKIGRATCKERV